MLKLIDTDFDVVVLQEILSTNIDSYSDRLPKHTLYYDLPENGTVGGVGVYINKKFEQTTVPELKGHSTGSTTVENIWVEMVNGTYK